MQIELEFYKVTLDFLYKISGPIIILILIGLFYRHRVGLASFISKNIKRISGELGGARLEIDLEKIKESQHLKLGDEERRGQGSELEKEVDIKAEVEGLRKTLEFEKIYSIILGSQINLLKKVQDKMLMEEVGRSFAEIKQLYPIYNDWSLNEFLRVLINNGLIYLKDEKYYHVTDKGSEFLKYIEENKYNDRFF